MPKKSYLRIKDLETGQLHFFKSYREVAEFCSEVTGMDIRLGTVYGAFMRCGTIANKRFATCVPEDGSIPTPDLTKIEDGWEFVQFEVTPTVLTAEKKLKWYDRERIDGITEDLFGYRCKVFWDLGEDVYQRKSTRVEVYKKFPKDVAFKAKIAEMKKILKEVGLW